MAQTIGQIGRQAPDILKLLFGSEVPLGAVSDSIVNGFFEELIVRAFLMTVILTLTRRSWLAVLISVTVQISYHFYQGVPAALSHIPLFTMYSVFFVRTRSILPVAIAHVLVDLYSLWHYGFHSALL